MMLKVLSVAAMAVAASATADPWACGHLAERCCQQKDCDGNAIVCENPGTDEAICVERTTSHCGECCGEEDCPYGTWCTDDNKCEKMCGTEGGECCNKTDCDGNHLNCEHAGTSDSVCVVGLACGEFGAPCCSKTDCDGNDVFCEHAGTDNAMCVERVASHCGECCGEEDCPKGTWCTDDNKCEAMCGTEGAECCNGTDCDGNHITCNRHENVCEPCGGNHQPLCPGGVCDEFYQKNHNGRKCVKTPCGEIGQPACEDGCKDGRMAPEAAKNVCVRSCGDPHWVCCDGPPRCKRHSLTCVNKVGEDKDGVLFKMSCVDCGGAAEPVCTEEGAEKCEAGLEDVDGMCEKVKEKVSCGGAGEEPCDDTGCDKPLIEVDGSCERCGANGEPLCADGCNEGFEPFSDADDDFCVPIEEEEKCGGDGEEPCKDTGCDGDLVDVDGVCGEEEEEDCGGIGELPCKDTGCDNDKSTSEASGGVCVTSCGEPAWTCCDGPSRCLRHTLTCVDKTGEDQDGVPFKMACVECGGEGEPICEEEGAEECEDGLVNVHGVCEHK